MKYGYPLDLALVQQEQHKYPRNINSKLRAYMGIEELDNVEIICFDKKIYVTLTLRIQVLD